VTDAPEIWKDVPGFPRYQASSLGRVKGPRHTTNGSLTIHGYYRTNTSVGGVVKEAKVHRLVALAFLGPAPEGKSHVNHIDGDKANNCPSNLEWCSIQENLRHNYEVLGRTSRAGVDDGFLNDDQVRAIRILRDAGMNGRQIARAVSRKYGTVMSVVNNKAWRHIH